SNVYGIYLNGLRDATTIYNNAIVLRNQANTSANTVYGLYAQSVSSINFLNNRINNPGMVTGGKWVGAYFGNAQNVNFKFNDVNSTAAVALNTAYLMQLANSTVTIRDNIFQSSWNVTASSASIFADRASGFDSDYNDWFSTYATRGPVL